MLAAFLLCAAFALSGATGETSEKILALLAPFLQGVENWNKCQPGWTSSGSRCFNFINSPRTWIEAERYCLQFEANLASIHSSQEHHFVRELVKRRAGRFTQTWIGGTDAPQPLLWIWTDGSRFDFQAWGSGEPNNDKGRELCLEMNSGGGSYWNDLQCENQLPFVCAKELLSCSLIQTAARIRK